MGYCNLSIFKMAAFRHLGILKLILNSQSNFRVTFRVIASNFVQIGRAVAENMHFRAF